MPKLDLDTIPQTETTDYPPEHAGRVAGRLVRRLTGPAGMREFTFSQVTLKPGAWSSQRHWHESEDEFVVILSGEAVLVEDDGETLLRAGDIAAWPKGVPNAHVLQNRSDADCVLLGVGGPVDGVCRYPDIGMVWVPELGRYRREDGSGY